MELSVIALKTLISFSLGLSANTPKTTAFGDTLKVAKTTTSNSVKKSKGIKQNNPKSESDAEKLSSCGKCGKG